MVLSWSGFNGLVGFEGFEGFNGFKGINPSSSVAKIFFNLLRFFDVKLEDHFSRGFQAMPLNHLFKDLELF